MTSVRNLLAMCATWGFLVFSHAEASEELSRDIAAQPLAPALSEFATQTGLQLIYVSEIAATQVSKGAPRGLAVPDALQRLLEGTGLRFEFMNDRTIRIFAGSSCALPSGCAGPLLGAAALAAKRPSRPPSPDDPLDEVIVTDSRWWLDPTEAVAPVTVLDRRDIERGGAEFDRRRPAGVADDHWLAAQYERQCSGLEPRAARRWEATDPSASRLHDLPTVVLLNGRRLPNSGLGADASVDLNTLPMSFVERVEVLASGASAAYRSECRRRRRQHRHATKSTWPRAQWIADDHRTTAMGRSSRGRRRSASTCSAERGAWGSTTSIRTASRWIGAATPRFRWSSSMATVRWSLLVSTTSRATGASMFRKETPSDSSPVSTHPCPAPPARRPLTIDRTCGNATASTQRHSTTSQTPNQRASLWLLGSHPLGETTNLFLEGFAHHRESALQAAPADDFDESRTGRRSSGIPADNYYNPFGVDVPQLRAAWSRPATAERARGRSMARVDRARRQRRSLDVGTCAR